MSAAQIVFLVVILPVAVFMLAGTAFRIVCLVSACIEDMNDEKHR